MAKTKPTTSKEKKNEGKYVFYYTFLVVECSQNTQGIPFSGYIYADTDTDAHAIAENIAKEVIDNLFIKSCNNEYKFSKNGKVYIPHSLDYKEVSVRRDEIVSAWGDAHDAHLRDCINEIYSTTDCRKSLIEITRAYWERDKQEIADRYCEDCVWWELSDKSFDDAVERVSFDEIAYELYNHIMDDEDYKVVIGYVRPDVPNNGWLKMLYPTEF